jgi:hypothetical protein
MISAVVRVEHGVEALALTLSALVPGVADGLVGDAVVLAATPNRPVEDVVDALGARLIVGADRSWATGAQAARRDWILCLTDGDVPLEGWIGALDRFIAASPADRGFGRLASRPARLGERLVRLLGSREVRAGDLVRRDLLLRGGTPPGRPARVSAAIERGTIGR